ncbi:hypothetical protein [Vibrio mexicanus]|uniref:hypothetical protein n=1 Tax=Vibrio mexicanus TaxID=1004326 RepID=UPI00063C55F4|nr:hypothetical protein [Vibrio mexicanus]
MKIESQIIEIEKRLKSVEARVTSLEQSLQQMNSQMRTFGKYKDRSEGELKLMDQQIDLLIESCEFLVRDAISQEEIIRAKAMLKRLKNNKTRILKARKAA